MCWMLDLSLFSAKNMVEPDFVVNLGIQHLRRLKLFQFLHLIYRTDSDSSVFFTTVACFSIFIHFFGIFLIGFSVPCGAAWRAAAMRCHVAQLWHALLGLSWLRHVTEPSAAGQKRLKKKSGKHETCDVFYYCF